MASPIGENMNAHERYQAFMRFEPVDRCPLNEWGPWPSTITRWKMESGLDDYAVCQYSKECDLEETTRIDFSMIPPFEERVISEDDVSITKIDRMGVTYREFKTNPETSMPEFIGFPVKNVADWKDIKRRFDPSSPGRYPENWQQLIKKWGDEKPMLRLYGFVETYYGGPSLYGFVRMLLGGEQVLYTFYDNPRMIHDMMDTITEFSMSMVQKALKEAPVTVVQFFEDMCYCAGSLISPSMFREFMLPRYKRMTELIRKLGVDIIIVDSDGKLDELIPLWLEAGINGVQPLEQAAGNDIFAYRRKYGKDLIMAGGIDKRVLAQGKAAIDRELEQKLPLAFQGGYIPHLDHSIPHDVPFENFQYYWKRKKKMLSIS